MEGLIQMYKTIKAEGKTFSDISLMSNSKGVAAKQRELLCQDYVWGVMDVFESGGVHYWHSDIMKFNDFYSTMFSSFGGVSDQSIYILY